MTENQKKENQEGARICVVGAQQNEFCSGLWTLVALY